MTGSVNTKIFKSQDSVAFGDFIKWYTENRNVLLVDLLIEFAGKYGHTENIITVRYVEFTEVG